MAGGGAGGRGVLVVVNHLPYGRYMPLIGIPTPSPLLSISSQTKQ